MALTRQNGQYRDRLKYNGGNCIFRQFLVFSSCPRFLYCFPFFLLFPEAATPAITTAAATVAPPMITGISQVLFFLGTVSSDFGATVASGAFVAAAAVCSAFALGTDVAIVLGADVAIF